MVMGWCQNRKSPLSLKWRPFAWTCPPPETEKIPWLRWRSMRQPKCKRQLISSCAGSLPKKWRLLFEDAHTHDRRLTPEPALL